LSRVPRGYEPRHAVHQRLYDLSKPGHITSAAALS
jgi:hypothetical protein